MGQVAGSEADGLCHQVQRHVQKLASLRRIDNSFRKIIVADVDIATYMDEHGYTFRRLFQFLKNERLIE